ncbi:hypothetical protein ACOMHN_028221 [Nucella lapillus]
MDVDLEKSAAILLQEAVRVDSTQPDRALILYTEGAQKLLQAMKVSKDEAKKKVLTEKVKQYIERAELLKAQVKRDEEARKKHTEISIQDGEKGHSYESLFGEFITEKVTAVSVEDPYIRNTHQIINFVRLCELLVKKAPCLKTIHLLTGTEEQGRSAGGGGPQSQREKFEMVWQSLQQHGVQLTVDYSPSLHDREIRLDTGWVIKIGRGLDIYKAWENKFSLGAYDYDLRPCQSTTVNIFHRNSVRDGTEPPPPP